MATSMWRDATDDPLPKLEPAEPEKQIESFELRVVDLLFSEATPETARDVAERTWDLVHDRPDTDPVKARVAECHEELAKLAASDHSV
jgi:hypothetical protein